MSSTPSVRRANRLAQETSPYLLQHAHNPVDWYPWGQEALALAKQLDRPILLSIGYSACHWCHVMERESFENDEVAAVMNRHFVCIKVDREERPDLDEIYMQATVAMNHGHGGWPMTVFLTPEQQPIYAGTYFPPEDRHGRPGFRTVLQKVADFWAKDGKGLREQAASFTERLKQDMHVAAPVSVGDTDIDRAVAQYREEFDSRYGGFGSAPKFPPATGLSLLLRVAHRTQDQSILQMVRKTLDGMAAGGIYDHIGGGFARYSTDEKWLVPHFEKMLYDNALLAKTYAEAYQVTKEPHYRRVVLETLDYILREMTSPDGAFYSATDADSEGVEGKFFVWRPEEVSVVLGDDEEARRVCAYYDITPGGNFEHASIPNTPVPLTGVATGLGLTVEALETSLTRARTRLYEARAKRVPPGLDDKIIVSWNGLMLSAMADASRICQEPRYLTAGVKAAEFLLRAMRKPDGRLYRTYRVGRPQHEACLEDYACLAEGLIDLYEAGAGERLLGEAVTLADLLLRDFRDETRGGFYTTGRGHEALILRGREGPDGATPSANAVAASVLARLSFHYGRDDWRQAATTAIRVYGKAMGRYPRAFAKSLIVADLLLDGPIELALVGQPGDAQYERLRRAVDAVYLPNRIAAHLDPSRERSDHPLLMGKTLVQGKAALYVCRNFACQAPVTDPQSVADVLGRREVDSRHSHQGERTLAGQRLPGAATVEGTARYAVRHVGQADGTGLAPTAYGPLGATGWTASRLGFGCYRVDTQEAEHREALVAALRRGCNLIDTSTNYGDGESERLVGLVLAEMIRRQELAREEVIVVSKIGYIQGHNFKQAQERERAGRPYPEMVKYGEGLWHCLHPEFLADQLGASLDRLGIAVLDVCLLHNPEYFLSEAQHRGEQDVESLRREFYRRLQAAFVYLERQVAAGRIRWYGVSSNTVTGRPEALDSTSLSRMVAQAEAAATSCGHSTCHFQVLQCPINLFESGAARLANTGNDGRETVLTVAMAKQVAVLGNRPLNAMPSHAGAHGGMIRLADFPMESVEATFETQVAAVAQLEQEYQRDLAPHVPHAGQGMAPKEYFTWAEELTKVRGQLQGLEQWDHLESQMIAPHLSQVARALGQVLQGARAEQWEAWRERYVPQLVLLLQVLRHEATRKSLTRLAAIRQQVDPLIPAVRRAASTSQKALWVVMSTPGVTSVLNGMRTLKYVEDSLGVLRWDLLQTPVSVYETVQSASRL